MHFYDTRSLSKWCDFELNTQNSSLCQNNKTEDVDVFNNKQLCYETLLTLISVGFIIGTFVECLFTQIVTVKHEGIYFITQTGSAQIIVNHNFDDYSYIIEGILQRFCFASICRIVGNC